jgi:hypothetical protein
MSCPPRAWHLQSRPRHPRVPNQRWKNDERARPYEAANKVVGEAEGHHAQALKGAIADAQQKMAVNGA